MGRKNAKIDDVALRQLNSLKRRVKAEYGLAATQEDIVSALVEDASVGHIAGILMAYQRARPEEPRESEHEDHSSDDT